MERKIKKKLGYTIRKAKEHGLEAKYRLHLGMREYLANLLGLEAGLWTVCIIEDDAPDIRLQCRSAFHTRIQLPENRLDYPLPIDVAFVHETIEHIFVADKHPAPGRRRIVGSILN